MEKPMYTHGEIAASVSLVIPGTIPLIRARTLTITYRALCGSSLDANPKVELFYSPDGNNWDSIAYTSWTVTYSAGASIQRTMIIDPPEHGYIMAQVTNQSSADVITNGRLWYTIQSYYHAIMRSKGDISTKENTD